MRTHTADAWMLGGKVLLVNSLQVGLLQRMAKQDGCLA